jgi:hypothetical protein
MRQATAGERCRCSLDVEANAYPVVKTDTDPGSVRRKSHSAGPLQL